MRLFSFRPEVVVAAVGALLMIACGGGQNASINNAVPRSSPSPPPTATPSPTPTPSPSPTPTPTASPTPTPTPAAVPVVDHVFLVVLENHGFAQVVGSTSMPYLNSLAAQQGLATQYYADTHPSIGNYFMLTTGAVETNLTAFSGTITDDNLVRAFLSAGKTWKVYAQSLPAAAYLGPDVYPYFKHHNPFVYFSDVVNSGVLAANIVPFTQLTSDVSAGAVPQFAYLLPDAENDAHDCPTGAATCADTDKLAAADTWLKTNMAPLMANPAFANSVFIVIFDEALDGDVTHGGGQVAAVIAGVHVKAGFSSTTLYQHESMLRLILDLLAVPDHPGLSATAPSMAEFFQ